MIASTAAKPVKAVKEKKPKAAKDTATEPKPEKKPKPVPTLDELERKHYRDIKDLQKESYRLCGEFMEANRDAQAKKKAWEAARCALERLIARGPELQLRLPLQDPKKAEASANGNGVPADDNSWRDVLLLDAFTECTEKELEKLNEIGVKTIGQFEDLRGGKLDGYPRGLLSIKGIGEAKITKFENALSDWWAARQKSTANQLAESDTAKLTLGGNDVEVPVSPESDVSEISEGKRKAK